MKYVMWFLFPIEGVPDWILLIHAVIFAASAYNQYLRFGWGFSVVFFTFVSGFSAGRLSFNRGVSDKP